MALNIGDIAPDFTLYSSDKELVRLSSYRGQPVVLLFFPLAFTSTCTKELCMTRDDLSSYTGLNAEVLAISVDSPQTLNRYKQEYALNFTLLSDFNKEVIQAYDVMYQEFSLGMRGVAKRAAFVVDADGVVRYAEVLENAGLIPDLSAVQLVLKQLQAVTP